MGTDTLEKVLERLATTEKSTIVVERASEGKVSCDIMLLGRREDHFEGSVLEVLKVDGRLHVAHKGRRPDEWDPPIAAHGPCDPGDV